MKIFKDPIFFRVANKPTFSKLKHWEQIDWARDQFKFWYSQKCKPCHVPLQLHTTALVLSASLRCNTTLLYRKAKMLFDPYFHGKTGSLLCTPLHKVTEPPESLKIEAKYAKVCLLRQGLIPGLLRGSQTTRAQIRMEQDGRNMDLNLIYFCALPLNIPATVVVRVCRYVCVLTKTQTTDSQCQKYPKF